MTSSRIAETAVSRLAQSERERFLTRNPKSAALAARAQNYLYGGVPMHWMSDWSTPSPLFVERAEGARFYDVDGHEYIDFCLGDSGSMFGHSPAPIAKALAEQGASGLTCMLPAEDAVRCGELLSERFGLPFWQMATTATDANRFALRWARAITGRKSVLLFDGCYHGTVDDVMVRCKNGRTTARAGLLGQAYDLTQYSRAVPFNDVEALEAALKSGDVAALLCEPAMTNIGMVLPEAGFMQSCRELTRKYGTLLIIDETHSLSTGYGGCTRLWDLQPDFFVLGKAIAGGVPASVYGCSAEMASAMQQAQQRASEQAAGQHGHSGMGTTLSAGMLAMHCMRVNLEQVMTEAAFAHMLALGTQLAAGLRTVISKHGLPWSVTELGARCEFQFCADVPKNGAEAEAAFHDSLQQALHLYLINRGILITPFHNMMLCSPHTSAEDVARLHQALDTALTELLA